MNKMMNPAQVHANRTARLVREAKTPTYTSETPAPREREHLSAVEIEFDTGGRTWVHMPESEVDAYIENLTEWEFFSDCDHSAKCWCQ